MICLLHLVFTEKGSFEGKEKYNFINVGNTENVGTFIQIALWLEECRIAWINSVKKRSHWVEALISSQCINQFLTMFIGSDPGIQSNQHMKIPFLSKI